MSIKVRNRDTFSFPLIFTLRQEKKFGIVVLYFYVQLGNFLSMPTQLGEKLRALRKERKLTLEQLATQAKLSKSYLWELENRESQRPSAEKLTALADVLGVSAVYFLEEDVREPEQKHLDDAFFRSYQQLDQEGKEQLRKILDTFKKS